MSADISNIDWHSIASKGEEDICEPMQQGRPNSLFMCYFIIFFYFLPILIK